jgi:hypothetical protein
MRGLSAIAALDGGIMRSVIAASALAAVFLSVPAAHAEKRLFVIANNSDGYGVDRCLTSAGACGETVANSYCRSHEYTQALSFHKVDRDDITGAIPVSNPGLCKGNACGDFVAIECSR